MRFIFLFLLGTGALGASAQNLSGIWRGNFKSDNVSKLMDAYGIEDSYKFEVQLNQDDKFFKGVTYSYKTTVFYGKASCYGAINKKNNKVFLEEIKILEVKSEGNGACIMTCFLQYSKVGNEEVLEGNYTSMSTADSTQCGKGTVFLRKVATSDFYKEPFLTQKDKEKGTKITPKQPEKIAPPEVKTEPPVVKSEIPKKSLAPQVKKPAPAPSLPKNNNKSNDSATAMLKKANTLKAIPADSLGKLLGNNKSEVAIPRVISTRSNEVVRTISTSAKDILIKIYDNGTIDNDTVTVYVDNKLVISKERLSEKPIIVKLALDEKILTHELVMVADNLGEIPPNTSLMVVTAGDQQYEVRITSTEQKNAVVLFKYESKKEK